MPKSDPVLETLARLKTLDPRAKESRAELDKAFNSKSNLIVARAAEIILAARLTDFAPALATAFDRFMVNPATTDKGCHAKIEIAKTLYEFEADVVPLFLRGIRHMQREPVWGGSVDTAAHLRGYCALGLVRLNYREVMTELADLLMDADPVARHYAARAVGYSEDPAGAPLLRMRILAGDPEPDVIAEAMASLVKLTPKSAITFLARLVDRGDEASAAALMALGQSRQPEALQRLIGRYDAEITTDARKPLLLAIAMTRLPAGVTMLLSTMAEEHRHLAVAAIEAMTIFRGDPAMREKVAKLVDDRDDKDIRAAFDKAFH